MEPEKRAEGGKTHDVQVNICLGQSPIEAFKGAMVVDREYHFGWHANLACAAMDAFAGACLPFEIRWQRSQETARRFIDVLFTGDPLRPLPITNEEVRSRPVEQDDTEDSKGWLSEVMASLEEAGKHEGPLDGRKLLGDLEKAVTLLLLGRMVPAAEAKTRALLEAKLERKHVEIGRVATELRISEAGHAELRAEAERLRVELTAEQNRGALARSELTLQNKHEVEEIEDGPLYYVLINDNGDYHFGYNDWGPELKHACSYTRARAEQHAEEKKCKIISKSDAVKRGSDDRWLIRSPYGEWFKRCGDGTTLDSSEAHPYTWMDAMKHANVSERHRVLHISDAKGAEA